MKTKFTDATRPRRASGDSTRRMTLRITTLTPSASPLTNSAASDSTKDVESPKTSIETPNSPTHDEEDRTRPTHRPVARREQHRQHGAPRRRGPQHTQPDRADVEDVAREDRQQRDGAAEEHGEQVQRHGAQQRLVVCGRTGRPRRGSRAGARRPREPGSASGGSSRCSPSRCQDHGDHARRSRGCRSRRPKAAGARARRCPRLSTRCRGYEAPEEACSIGITCASNALSAGRSNPAATPTRKTTARINGSPTPPATRRGDGEHDRARDEDHARDEDDRASVAAVGDVPADEHQPERWDRFHEAEQAQREGWPVTS